LCATVDAELGRLDAFFNNAGIFAPASRFVDIPTDRLSQLHAAPETARR
jgi:NAD(P)-dependent dehydrogenase (short-subunit alcohol dehydrogenase family)